MTLSKQWSDELTAFTRAFAGAAVFGIPLVMTMEMWWIGKTLPFTHIVWVLVIGLLANFGLAHVAGFRDEKSIGMAIDQAIDAMAVGVVGAGVLLVAMHQLRPADGLGAAIDMIMLLAVPLSLGASVARLVFSGRGGRDGEQSSDLSAVQGLLSDAGATVIGGLFIGMSIAPTDEVKMIAAGLTIWHLYAVIALTLFLSYLIVFASGFDDASPEGPLQHPFSETVFTYVLSLLVAFGLLQLFGRISMDDPLHEIVRQTVVLAIPAAIGGAGGRLVI